MNKGLVDEMDSAARELAGVIVQDIHRMKKQISRPAMSRKLTRKELWERHGEEYMQTREDPQIWQMTLEQMGEGEALEFSRTLELAMMEEYYGGSG